MQNSTTGPWPYYTRVTRSTMYGGAATTGCLPVILVLQDDHNQTVPVALSLLSIY